MKKIPNQIKVVIPFLLTLLFLFFAFKDVNINEALNWIWNTNLGWFSLFILVFIFSHLLRAYRWKFIISSVKPDAKLLHLFGAVMVGYGINSVVPRLGELYRALFLGKWENISRTSMMGTIIVERVIDILALAFSVMISVLLYDGDLLTEILWLRDALILIFVVLAIVILMIVLLVIFKDKFYDLIIRFVNKFSSRIANKLAYLFKTLIEGFASLKGKTNYTMTIAITVLIMVIYGLNTYISFLMLGMQNINEVTYSTAWILMTISAFGIIIPTPGGTGSYHFIVISVLVSIFHFNQEISSAFALITHTVSYVLFVGLALFFIVFVNKTRKRHGEEQINLLNVFKDKSMD